MKGFVICVGKNDGGNSNFHNDANLYSIVFREDNLEATEILGNDSLGPKLTAKKFAVV